jgi:hypothetical protein
MVELRHSCVGAAPAAQGRFVLGTVDHGDSRQKVVSWSGPEGASGQVGYDRLILTAGSMNKLLPIAGLPITRTGSTASPKRSACAEAPRIEVPSTDFDPLAGAAHSAPRRGLIGLVPAPLAGNLGSKVRRRLRAGRGI